jgi:hypothetical protein
MDINPLTNLRRAYEELERHVQRSLNTQVGDNERLARVQDEVLLYIQAVEQVCRKKYSIRKYNDVNPEYSTQASSHLRSSYVAGRMLSLWCFIWTKHGRPLVIH